MNSGIKWTLKELRQNLIEKDLQARLLNPNTIKRRINGAVTGTKGDTQFLLDTLNELNFNNLIINRYSTATEAFDRFIVKIKNEIVTSDFNVKKLKKVIILIQKNGTKK